MWRTPYKVDLNPPVKVGSWVVVGYDRMYKQPVLSKPSSLGMFLLSEVQRAGWDNDEEAFTDIQLKQIEEAVRHQAAETLEMEKNGVVFPPIP